MSYLSLHRSSILPLNKLTEYSAEYEVELVHQQYQHFFICNIPLSTPTLVLTYMECFHLLSLKCLAKYLRFHPYLYPAGRSSLHTSTALVSVSMSWSMALIYSTSVSIVTRPGLWWLIARSYRWAIILSYLLQFHLLSILHNCKVSVS